MVPEQPDLTGADRLSLQRPDVNAVLHTLPIPTIAFSIVDVPIKPVIRTARYFYERVPVCDEYDSTSPGSAGLLVATKADPDLK